MVQGGGGGGGGYLDRPWANIVRYLWKMGKISESDHHPTRGICTLILLMFDHNLLIDHTLWNSWTWGNVHPRLCIHNYNGNVPKKHGP